MTVDGLVGDVQAAAGETVEFLEGLLPGEGPPAHGVVADERRPGGLEVDRGPLALSAAGQPHMLQDGLTHAITMRCAGRERTGT